MSAFAAATILLPFVLIKEKKDDKKVFHGLTRLEMAQATAKVMRLERERRKTGKGRRYGKCAIR